MIIGCPGSGKSTLARALKEKLGLPLIHLDQLWWQEGWTHVSREEFDARLELAVNMDRWIIDGNYSRTIGERIPRCDTIIYLDFSRLQCLLGLFQRILESHGKVRPDMAEGCPERLYWDHVKYVWNFNKNNRVRNETWLAQARHAQRIVLKSRKEVKEFLAQL